MTLRHCFIFDVEQTLSDDKDRHHLIPSNPKAHEDWTPYQDQFEHDKPLFGPMAVARSLQVLGFEIVISTGLPYQLHLTLNNWLLKYSLICKHIFMRTVANQESRIPSVALKLIHLALIREQLGYHVAGAFDDREDICDMYQRNKVLTFKIN